MPTFTNAKTGEVLNSVLTNKAAADKFVELFGDRNDDWRWFWIHKAVMEASQRTADQAIDFIADSFIVAIGNGARVNKAKNEKLRKAGKKPVKQREPMIRLHFKDQRFKIYLSRAGTICIKTGRLALDAAGNPTKDPVGDEVYMGCLVRGKFLPASQGYGHLNGGTRGPDRVLTPTEKEFLDNLFREPVPFMAKCSKDLGRCCYCNLPLSDPTSKRLGYGKICAGQWGLPWGSEEHVDKVPSFAQKYNRDAHNFCLAIRENPRDEARWMMFSDWLTERGMNGLDGLEMPDKEVIIPRSDS